MFSIFDLVGSLCLCSLLIVFKRPCISVRHVNLASGRTQTTTAKAAQSPLRNEKRAHHEAFSNSKGSSPPGLNIFYLKEISFIQSQECSEMSNANGHTNIVVCIMIAEYNSADEATYLQYHVHTQYSTKK